MVTLLIVGVAQAAPRDVTTAAVTALEEWLGPLPDDRVPPPPASGIWPVWRGDRAIERAVIADLARRYWFEAVRFPPGEEWAAAALVRFTAVRVISDLLESDHYATPRFFRGRLRFPVRYVPISTDPWEGDPPPATFDEIEAALADIPNAGDARAHRAARALQTLERHLGRAMFESALAEFARRGRRPETAPTVANLILTIEGVAGRELSWFFGPAFRVNARYDYAVASLETERRSDGQHESRVVVQRLGDAIFSGTSQPPVPGFEAGRGIEILVEFADGTEVREHWDGRAESRTSTFTARAPVVAATVDPEVVLLLDANWQNNGKADMTSSRPAVAQWSLLWMAWLQQFMLTLTAAV
jgi:hypothetical protein